MTHKSNKKKVTPRYRANDKVLDEFRLLFVFHYHGAQTAGEAVTKAAAAVGTSYKEPSHTAHRLLKEPLVQKAIELKHQGAIEKLQESQGKIMDVAAEEGFTLRELFRNLVPLMKGIGFNAKGKPRAVRDYDRIKAMELGAKICEFLRPAGYQLPTPPPGTIGSAQAGLVREGEKVFFMYRSEWRDDPGGTNPPATSGAIIPASPR